MSWFLHAVHLKIQLYYELLWPSVDKNLQIRGYSRKKKPLKWQLFLNLPTNIFIYFLPLLLSRAVYLCG